MAYWKKSQPDTREDVEKDAGADVGGTDVAQHGDQAESASSQETGVVDSPLTPQPGNVECEAKTGALSVEESCSEKILQELQSLREAHERLAVQLNEKKRLPSNYLPSFLSNVKDTYKEEIKKLTDELSPVKEQLASLQQSTEHTRDFVQQIEDERVKTLYAENEKYKADLLKRFTDDLLENVIRQLDEAEKTVKRLKNKIEEGESITTEEFFETTREIVIEFKDMLQDRYKLTEYTSDGGAATNERHRISPRKESTTDRSLDGKIAKSVSCGYEYGNGKVFRQESVVVYKYEEPVDHTGTAEKTTAEESSSTDLPANESQPVVEQDTQNNL